MTKTPSADVTPVSVEALRREVEEALGAVAPEVEPPQLFEPVRYVLAGGGKRLRPVLLLLTAGAYGVPTRAALPAALAVELFHNFTLVHDDIMDHADARRGRPTVHVRWDETTAILCGDYLLALAYRSLADVEGADARLLFRVFHDMVRRLCVGQTLDTDFERRRDVSVDEYLHMIDGKTGALLECTFELGGLVGGANEADRAVLRAVGRDVGRAFQIQDDLLDLTADHARWGKTIGGDLLEGKKAFLLLRALERAEGDEHRWFARIVDDRGLPAEAIDEARARMERLGVLQDAQEAVQHYSRAALDGLDRLPPGPHTDRLHRLLRQMSARLH